MDSYAQLESLVRLDRPDWKLHTSVLDSPGAGSFACLAPVNDLIVSIVGPESWTLTKQKPTQVVQ